MYTRGLQDIASATTTFTFCLIGLESLIYLRYFELVTTLNLMNKALALLKYRREEKI